MTLHTTPINHWHIVISGFLQREGAPNGMLRLATRLHAERAAADCMVEMRLWHDRMSGLAEKIWLLRPESAPPQIRMYGYSWGGAAALRLAAELKERGLPVEIIVLTDAVYRHWYWAGNWRSFWPLTRLRVPANVRRVEWFSQRQNWPQGHQIVPLDSEATAVVHRGELGVTHQYMDDAWPFVRRALEVAAL
jgi:thioesterase domain-containing protein